MSFKNISNFTKKLLLDANFGIEREGLRVTAEGVLSKNPHPAIFGSKEGNPYITTDFSESQLELITPIFHSTSDAHNFLDSLYNIAALELTDEFVWPQSMPAITPKNIPVAVFDPNRNSEKDRYRDYLLQKYGGKKQLISGIHINFSLSERLLKQLHKELNPTTSFFDFKNDVYLKMARNFLRFNWLLIYLLGATNMLHRTYEEKCVKKLNEINTETYSDSSAISFRNSSCGYQNEEVIMPNYESIKNYTCSLNAIINEGILKDIRELYSPIRLKGNGEYSVQNIVENGIEYIEIRSIDINPFQKSGLDVQDLDFIHLFLLFCFFKDENTYNNWQDESYDNNELVAKQGLDDHIELTKDGEKILLQEWAMQILNEMLVFSQEIDSKYNQMIKSKMNQINNKEMTYSYRISQLCKEKGYIEAHLELAKHYREQAFKERFQLKPYTDLELSTQILLSESIKRGITFDILDRKENFIKLTNGDFVQYIKQATKTSADQYVSVLIMENKSVTKKVLGNAGMNVPKGDEFFSLEEANLAISDWLEKPCVIKPKSTNFGLGISIFSEGTDSESLQQAFEIAFSEDDTVLIEDFIPGNEYRFLTIGEETVAVLQRVPANVYGDGVSTIEELIERKNKDVLRGKGYKTPLEKIQIDENMKLFLKQDNKTVDYVVPIGEMQLLRENSNISTGGDSIDMTDKIPAFYKKIAVEAAKSVGAKICGVDMIIKDLRNEFGDYSIIELNFNPAIHIHSYPYKGEERNIAEKILSLLQLV